MASLEDKREQLARADLHMMYWSGAWDDKLRTEWRAAQLEGTPTVIVHEADTVVPPEVRDHDVVVGLEAVPADLSAKQLVIRVRPILLQYLKQLGADRPDSLRDVV